MIEYVQGEQCLMQFLLEDLNDPNAVPCGRCAVCLGESLVPESVSEKLIKEAITFLRRDNILIPPRLQWPSGVQVNGWLGRIAPNLLAEPGRALCRWGDAGWGESVRDGKQVKGHFSDQLVDAMVDLVRSRWQPTPPPRCVTFVPSLRSPTLVEDFAQRVADRLEVPLVPCVHKVHATPPQKEMQNSSFQAKNLDGAFRIDQHLVQDGPVLLLDDIVDSRWTFTILSALLREAGSGLVYPAALADAGTR